MFWQDLGRFRNAPHEIKRKDGKNDEFYPQIDQELVAKMSSMKTDPNLFKVSARPVNPTAHSTEGKKDPLIVSKFINLFNVI